MEEQKNNNINSFLSENKKESSSNICSKCNEEEKETQKYKIKKNSYVFCHKILENENQIRPLNHNYISQNRNHCPTVIKNGEHKIKDETEHKNYMINIDKNKDKKYDILLKDKSTNKNIDNILFEYKLLNYKSKIENKKNSYFNDNEIKLTIKILEKDINKKIFFLDNTDSDYYYENGVKVSHHHDNLLELNEDNTKLYINDKEQKYKKYFIPKKSGDYNIKIVLNILITNCVYMFSECKKIINIDLSLLNTKNVVNMKNMFYHCENLSKIDLSLLNTTNVSNMENMFTCCKNLINLDLSSFKTNNVINMKEMFSNCNKLINIDLYSFNTENVINMEKMFNECNNITNLDLSFFNTKKVINMEKMFFHCNNLIKIDLSSFIMKNTVNLEGILYYSKNLISNNNSSLLDDINNNEILDSFNVNNLKINRKSYNKTKNKAYFRKQIFIIEI